MNGEVIVSKLLEGETLSHYGIKGQQWGLRRFQNEDGSLTAEGRERYGLKGGLSSMSDDELRRAISKKQTENNYIRLQTEQARRHQANISGFVKELTGTISTATNQKLQDVYLNKYKKQVADDNTNLQAKKAEALKTGDKEKATEYDKIIKMNNDSLKSIGDAITTTGKVSEELGKQSNLAGKILTRGELKEAQDRAYRNIAEMDEKQLKSVVDRMLLEEQYKNLVDPPKPTKLEKGREWLQTVGSILGVTLTALTIAGMIKGTKTEKTVKHADDSDNYLEHYGVKGMKKGDRRYQNEDGSLTAEGYIHYGINPRDPRAKVQEVKNNYKVQKEQIKSANKLSLIQNKAELKEQQKFSKEQLKEKQAQDRESLKIRREQIETRRKNIMKVVVGTAAIAGIAALGYNYIHQQNLDSQMMRDMAKKEQEGKQILQQLNIQNKAGITQAKAQMANAQGKVLENLKDFKGTNMNVNFGGRMTVQQAGEGSKLINKPRFKQVFKQKLRNALGR